MRPAERRDPLKARRPSQVESLTSIVPGATCFCASMKMQQHVLRKSAILADSADRHPACRNTFATRARRLSPPLFLNDLPHEDVQLPVTLPPDFCNFERFALVAIECGSGGGEGSPRGIIHNHTHIPAETERI